MYKRNAPSQLSKRTTKRPRRVEPIPIGPRATTIATSNRTEVKDFSQYHAQTFTNDWIVPFGNVSPGTEGFERTGRSITHTYFDMRISINTPGTTTISPMRLIVGIWKEPQVLGGPTTGDVLQLVPAGLPFMQPFNSANANSLVILRDEYLPQDPQQYSTAPRQQVYKRSFKYRAPQTYFDATNTPSNYIHFFLLATPNTATGHNGQVMTTVFYTDN